MAPGLRSGRTGHPGALGSGGEEPGGGGCSLRRTRAAGGEGRCLRSRCGAGAGAGAAGMLARCLLSAGMLSLLARCALAAEEKPNYDASGSSSLQSDPAPTAAPVHPLADLSVAEAVPFSVVHSDGEPEGEGLLGQPAFSSVLTVMAGTVKHPVSLDQIRTSPTITRDETDTTQWPSHSSSQGSEMSSSSLSAGDRILLASSGVTSNVSHQYNTQSQAVTMASTISRPSHVSFMNGNKDTSLFSSSTVSISSLSSSVSPSAPSTSSVLSSALSLFSLPSPAGWINKAASLSQSQRIISSPASQTKTTASLPARSVGWTDNVTTTQSISHSDVDLTAVTWGLPSTTTKASGLVSKTSIEKSNKVTKQSPADKIHDVSGTYRSASTETGTYTSYSTPNHEQKILYRPTQTQNLGMTSVSASNLEISTSFPSNQESQAVERQQRGLENPTSALLSARPRGYSVSSHVIQQMLNHTAYARKENKTFVPKSVGGAVMSLLSSRVVNPTVSPALTFTPAGSFFTASSQIAPGKTSLSVTAISELTPIHSGIVSSEYAPNPGDLLMAEGQDSTRVPAININYNQGEIAEAQLRSISPQAHLNNSLLPSQPRPESTTGSILSLIATTGTTSSMSESGSLHLSINRVLNIQEFATQTDSPKVITESLGWLTQNMIFPYKNMNESVSHPTWPTYILPLFSHSPNDNTNDHNTALSAKSEINFADQAKASSQITPSPTTFQTRSLLTFPYKFHTPPPQKSQQTVAKSPAHITESKAVHSSTIEVKTSAGNVITATGGTSSLSSNRALNIHEFVTQTKSPKGITQKSIGWSMQNMTSPFSIKTVSLSGSVIPVKLPKDITNKMFESISQPTQPTYLLPLLLSHSPNHNNTDHEPTLSTNSEVNFADHAKASLSSQITPSQRPFQTRSLLTFPHKSYISDLTPPHNKSHQTVSEISAHITKSKAVHSTPSTFEVRSRAGSGEPSPPSNVLTTHRKWPSESVHRNTEKTSVSPLLDENGESSSIRHTAFNKKGVQPGQFTTLFPPFMTTKDFYVLSKGSETSGKGSPTEIPFSPVPFDAALGSLKSLSRKDDVTLMGRYEQASSSTWSEIILAQRKTSTSHSQGSITGVSSNKSNFYLDTQTTTPSISSSDATTSSGDGQNSSETFSSIFSFGSKIMAPYTKWKTTKPSHQVSFQSTASKLEYTSLGFDRTNSDLQADGPSYEHPKLEDEQERIMHILNSTVSTVVANDPSSLYPMLREHPSFTSTSGSIEQSLNLSPVYHGSTVADNIQPGATVNTPAAPSSQGSDGFLFRSHVTTDTATSSQASSVALVYKSKQTPLLSDVGSLEAAFRTVVTHSNNPALRSSETINNTGDSKPKELGLPAGPMSSSSSFPPSPLSSEASSVSYSHIKASQLSYLHMDPPAPMSSKSSSSSLSLSTSHSAGMTLSIKPTMYPGTASSSASVNAVPATSPSSSPSLTLSIDSEEVTKTFVVLTEAGTDEFIAGTSRAVELSFPKEKAASLAPSQSVRITLSAGPTERTSQVSPLPPQQDTTTASVRLTTTTVASTTTPSPRVTTGTTQSTTTTTPQPTPVTRRTTTTTAIRSQTSRRTFTPPVPRTSPPRGTTTIFISPFTTTTEAPPQQCNITERLWVKTVVSIYVRRNRLDSIQRQNLRRGLSQGLRKALNDSSAQAQVETVFGSPNMTVAYHVTGGDIVYPPSVVLEGLDSYGRDKLIADLRQYLPMVTALPLPVTSWRPIPATGYQLKTVLQFVGEGDDPRSCRFSQMMEQRLEKVFSEAQAKVLNINSRLSVQMLSVSQAASSPAVSLVYTVKNGTIFLNGTTASNLLGQLSAELVGYFLFYPPLIIAEPMEYHNLNTSIATRDFWVITVIQDVDNTSLEGQYQSFASLMEQRLAELFVLAGQQGTRFRRATAVGSYTVQMVSIRRVSGLKNPAEMTYYVQHNGIPLSGTSAAKVLNTVDSQTMALTLGYFVQLQAEPVVKNPPNNLWIIAAVLAPIAVVTLIIFIITAVLCRKNKNDFKADAIGNLNPRAKMAYRRDVGYYHQPVQGFDYAKQHLGQQGGDEETLPASQDTLVMSLQIRDTPLSLEKALQQDGTANKKSLTTEKHKSKLRSEDGSVISNESEKLNSGRGLTVLKVTAQQKLTKEETRKRDDPYDTSSGSLQLISIKPMAAQPNYSHPASSDRSQDSAIVNGEVNLALKQKSDIEHYRNKLRLKAKRKGYYDFPSTDGSSSSRAMVQRQRHGHERAAGEHGRPLEPDDERGSTYVKSHRRHSQVGQTAYRSRQSLSSPSPGGTEMDLLVMRERPRRGIRNSGYDTEPELIEETNVDRLMGTRGYMYGRGLKGHSETSTLSSQPSIDEVRQQMHLLLEEAFSLASGGQSTSGRRSHHHHPPPDHYSHAPPPLPYADVVTSAPGTMSCGRGGLQWVPSYGADVYQCSLPKPAFHFTQLPEMAMGSPPPLPPRTGPPPGTSLRRSTSDLGPKGRSSETSVTEMQSQHDNNPYGPTTRAVLPSITAEQPVSNYSGNPITAVYAIPATRPGYSEYFVSTPPTSYHSPSWMSYPPEPEDVPPQWADSLPLPGYVEAFPHPRYPQGSPTRLPLQYNQALEQPPTAPSTASQQSLPQVVKDMDSMPLSSLSTSALVQAIRQEVAKLAKKQNDVFEF